MLRALPDYEPKPGPSPRGNRGRRRLRVVAEPPPPVGEVPPALAGRIRHLINQVLEALDGRRPVVQLRPQFTPAAYGSIETRARRPRATANRSRLHSLHAQQPTTGIVEACGVAEIDTRRQALAAQFEVQEPLRCNVFRVL
ncbi:Rv3235 family protein [Kutzneria sp. NPDC052558]|uniref:Rv3235 family protein n=1 Tax=Kutzneria sp. NPDC052558 TaxID=3364121 RepID=UPI0037CB6745